MVGDTPELSVVIVTYNGREKALATLRAAQARLGAISCEWFVVDNESTDGTPEGIEREFPDVTLIRSGNHGFAAGNNVALGRAVGRYVLLLNPDVEIENGTLADLVRALDERQEVGIASVLQQSTDRRLLPSIRRFPTPSRTLGEALCVMRLPGLARLQERDLDFDDYERERSVDWLVGAFLFVRRAAIEQVGLLDDSFFLYAEETDWCLRFKQHGWDVRHLPFMTVTHHEGESTRPDLIAQLGHSRRRYAYKHLSRPRAGAIHVALALGHLLRVTLLTPPALIRPSVRRRLRAEAMGLAVLCGGPPPFESRPSSTRAS